MKSDKNNHQNVNENIVRNTPNSDKPEQNVSGDSRRDFLKKLAAGGFGVGLLTSTAAASADGTTTARAGFISKNASESEILFHFGHLTDMHVRRQRKGHIGYDVCVNSVNSLDPAPDFLLMGGDLAFDGLYNEKADFEDMIHLYKTGSDKLNMPYYNCIGNHDVLGWSNRRKVPVDDPDIGKKMIMDRLGMDNSYYSFDHKGWHFVVLDTIHPYDAEHGPSYVPRLGREQLDWLRYDLGVNDDKPTVCVMHIAAFCNVGQINGDPAALAMNHMVIQDNLEFRQILERHNVKAVLQGHSHQVEDFFYNGVWYITSQSVSAAWWGGNWRGFKPGYTILSAHENGELSWNRHEFEWEHHLEPEDMLERDRIEQRENFVREQRRLYEKEVKGIRD